MKTVQNCSKQVWWSLVWWTTWDVFFSLEQALLWIMDSYFDQKWWFEIKNILIMDLFPQTSKQLFTSQDIVWWTGVVWITCGLLWWFYQLFGLSFWRHPFTAEDPLVNKWCNATFLQTWWRNKLIYILKVSKFSGLSNCKIAIKVASCLGDFFSWLLMFSNLNLPFSFILNE